VKREKAQEEFKDFKIEPLSGFQNSSRSANKNNRSFLTPLTALKLRNLFEAVSLFGSLVDDLTAKGVSGKLRGRKISRSVFAQRGRPSDARLRK
jgi:hypothetical protein